MTADWQILGITFPSIRVDFWLGFLALGASVAWSGWFGYKLMADPLSVLAGFGYEAANKDSAWPVTTMWGRQMVLFMMTINAIALYYWHTISMAYALWFLIVLDLPSLGAVAYRAFVEDPANGLCTVKSKENAKRLLKMAGAKTGLMVLAATVLYCEFYNGTNYANDAKHGLPAELTMMLGVVKNKFLKGHH